MLEGMFVYEGVSREGKQKFFGPIFGTTRDVYTPQQLENFARYTITIVTFMLSW